MPKRKLYLLVVLQLQPLHKKGLTLGHPVKFNLNIYLAFLSFQQVANAPGKVAYYIDETWSVSLAHLSAKVDE